MTVHRKKAHGLHQKLVHRLVHTLGAVEVTHCGTQFIDMARDQAGLTCGLPHGWSRKKGGGVQRNSNPKEPDAALWHARTNTLYAFEVVNGTELFMEEYAEYHQLYEDAKREGVNFVLVTVSSRNRIASYIDMSTMGEALLSADTVYEFEPDFAKDVKLRHPVKS